VQTRWATRSAYLRRGTWPKRAEKYTKIRQCWPRLSARDGSLSLRRLTAQLSDAGQQPLLTVANTPYRFGHFGLPVHFFASHELHGRFKCCPESHSTSAILSTCPAMFCTSATFTATAFPSPSRPCQFLCTTYIPSLAFLLQLSLTPQIPICFPDGFLPILAHLLPWHGV
jgi:hypothetical protein